MKALQCVELGGPDKLQVNEIQDPKVLPGHVLVENKAGSVNFPDVLMIQGLYPVSYTHLTLPTRLPV